MHKHNKLPEPFTKLGLDVRILRGLKDAGFETPSDIQREMIPVVLTGRDVIGQARTGTGKTAAFGLPILQMADPAGGFQALILTPTRELAVQVTAELKRLGTHTGVHCVPVYGGQKIVHQIHALGRKPHVVVGTPGRVMDLLGRGHLRFDHIRFAVLDEVDRMLDIGFRDDIRKILGQVRTAHQTVFVSATIDKEIQRLAGDFTHDAAFVNVSKDEMTVDEVNQVYVSVQPWDKFNLLTRLLEREDPRLVIVFTNTKHAARKLAKRLHSVGVDAKEIHGDLLQQRRERVMEKFRKHKIKVLVATDLAARGIDVQGISHIINYDFPRDPDIYVHRIGRTARMGAFGAAYSFVSRDEGKELTEVEKLINKQVPEVFIEGFVPRDPPRETRRVEDVEPAAEPSARLTAPTFGQTGETSPSRPRTLGGKFRPSRRRRR